MSLPETDEDLRLVVYSRPGCHLCELLIEELAPMIRGCLALDVRDIDTRPDWQLEYGVQIPLVQFRGETVCRYHLDAPAVRALLDELEPS